MSLRAESLKAYRVLYRSAAVASSQCALYNHDGLQRYVSTRFGAEVEQNRLRLGQAMQELETKRQGALAAARRRGGGARELKLVERSLVKQQRKLLRQYEQYVSQRIDHTRDLALKLLSASDDEALVSLLQVLAAGVGNGWYQRTMESNFSKFFDFEAQKVSRDEATEEATSERQNRVMQQAILPYGERLLLAHRTAIGEGNHASALAYLTPWQVTEAIVGTRSGVTAHHLRLGRDHVVVEVDETYNKQVVYLCCTRAEGADSGSYHWDQEVERVDVAESEEVRRTLFHSEFLMSATRLCDALVHETPLHPTRKTVLTGHAVGGAVAMIMALLLSQRGFEVSNVITFGAPKSMQGTLERFVAAVNPIRVVLAGDPLVELPVTGTEGQPFVHVGEILLLTPRPGDGVGEEEGGEEEEKRMDEPAAQSTTATARSAPAAAPEMSAEDLAAAMADGDDDDEDNVVSSSGSSNRHDGDAETAKGRYGDDDDSAGHRAGQDRDAIGDECGSEGQEQPVEEEEEEEEEEDLRRLCRIAEERYTQNFLVEHYIRHLADPTVELTYAEGDEVWDDGEYATSMRNN